MRVRITSVTGETLEDNIDCARARPPRPTPRSARPRARHWCARARLQAAASQSEPSQRRPLSQRRAAAPAGGPT